MEPEPPGAPLFLPGTGADPIRAESDLGHRGLTEPPKKLQYKIVWIMCSYMERRTGEPEEVAGGGEEILNKSLARSNSKSNG